MQTIDMLQATNTQLQHIPYSRPFLNMFCNSLFEVTLTRDDVSPPWGFSLAGGRQCCMDLFVSRTQMGSPAGVSLTPGEVVVGINGFNVRGASLHEATCLAKRAGYQLVLLVERRCMNVQNEVIVLHKPAGYSCVSYW
uniref:PDZ domain-containing protein n=1 Tax=Platynereis dumerilii TaxID=6359 RepID=A4VB08_PLADU|nr:hypothetical protein [Platynereis dumerilii]